MVIGTHKNDTMVSTMDLSTTSGPQLQFLWSPLKPDLYSEVYDQALPVTICLLGSFRKGQFYSLIAISQ